MFGWLPTAVTGIAGLLAGRGPAVRRAGPVRGAGPRPSEPTGLSQDPFNLVSVISGLAHELRNPLSSLKLNLQLLDEDLKALLVGQAEAPCGRRVRNRLATAATEASRLERTLEEFLRFASNPSLELRCVELNGLVAELLDFFLPQATAHGIRLRAAPAQGRLVCMVDPSMLKQAVLNLLVNAQQAMTAGGELIVRTQACEPGGRVRLLVTDTGPGMAPGEIDKIFVAYYSTKRGGTGLGLPIARRIVQAHGGTLTVRSEVGKGSEFCLELPLAREVAEDPASRA